MNSAFSLLSQLVSRAAIVVMCGTIVVLAGCAAPQVGGVQVDEKQVDAEATRQQDMAAQTLLADYVRLLQVAYPLHQKATPFCAERERWTIGEPPFAAKNFSDEGRKKAFERLGMSLTDPTFVFVVEGTPLQQAGVRPGDHLLKINSTSLSNARVTDSEFSRIVNEAGKERRAINLEINRAGQTLQIPVQPVVSCGYRFAALVGDDVNAYADGNSVVIFRGLMRFFPQDADLAVIVGHEMAHNALRHIDAKQRNATLGTLADLILATRGVNTQGLFGSMGSVAYSQDFEREADRLGMYLAALAGHNLQDAANIWRRMAANNPGGINRPGQGLPDFTRTHPATSERFVALGALVQEIEGKRSRGEPLNLQDKSGKLLVAQERSSSLIASKTPIIAQVRTLPAYEAIAGVRQAAVATANAAPAAAVTPVSTPTPAAIGTTAPAVIALDSLDAVPTGADGKRAYLDFLSGAKPRAFAIGRQGRTFRVNGSARAGQVVLAECNKTAAPCVLYAVDDQVVWDRNPNSNPLLRNP